MRLPRLLVCGHFECGRTASCDDPSLTRSTGPLDGIIVAIKAEIDVRGYLTTDGTSYR